MKKARCVPTIASAALSLAFPLHSVFSYLKKKKMEEILHQKSLKITIYSPPFSGVLFCDNFTHFFPRRGLLNLPSEARQIECTSLGKK